MIIVRDESMIKRRKRIANIASFGGIGILLAGMLFSMMSPNLELPLQIMAAIPVVSLVVGFILSQVGLYYTNRWGRSPRPDELLDLSLKGLDKKYALFHYVTPASHLLYTPSGVTVLVIRPDNGVYRFENGKWRQKMTAGRILTFLGRESVGNPTNEVQVQIEQVRKWLGEYAPEYNLDLVNGAVVFLGDKVKLDVIDPPVPVVRAPKLKGFVRSSTAKQMPPAMKRTLTSVLGLREGN